MKFEIRYDARNKRFYAPKTAITVIAVITLITVVIGTLTAYRLLQDQNQLKTPREENQPLTLGVAPVEPETLPPTKEAASSAVLGELKKQHRNKFNIIFFYDGYQNQKDALLDIEVAKQVLDLVEPFKSLKDSIAFKIFTTEGQICHVQTSAKKILKCDTEMIRSFNRLGIDHFKLVILSPLDFVPAAEIARGKNSAIFLPGKSISRFFIHELGHSLGLRDEYTRDRPEDYLRGAISCFYAGKESIIFPAGFETTHSAKLANCDTFRAEFPNFWEE